MAIDYSLSVNKLTTDANDFAAQVHSKGAIDLEGLIDQIAQKGSTVTRSDIAAVLEDTIAVMENLLLLGFRVNIGGLVDIYPRIGGKFTGPLDAYDPARHTLTLGASAGSRIKKAFSSRAEVVKVEARKPTPNVMQYFDSGTQTADTDLSRGNIGTLNGKRLKFDPAAADEGLYLVNVGTGAETKVSTLQKNTSTEVVFLVPGDLEEFASYRAEVRTRINGGQELRSGHLDKLLMAA